MRQHTRSFGSAKAVVEVVDAVVAAQVVVGAGARLLAAVHHPGGKCHDFFPCPSHRLSAVACLLLDSAISGGFALPSGIAHCLDIRSNTAYFVSVGADSA